MKVAVLGIGKLGSSMVAVFAAAGHHVYAMDKNREVVDKYIKGDYPKEEPDLAGMLSDYAGNITYSTLFHPDITECDVIFCIVPTPTDETGEFTNKYVLECIKGVGTVTRYSKKRQVFVITSTVKLGSMRDEIAPELEMSSHKKVGKDIGLIYNPEFIALGNVVHGLIYPDTLLIGESDKKSGDVLEKFYKTICPKKPHTHRMSWENAELSKLSLNVFITTKISLANMYAEICDKIPGGNAKVVSDFVGEDSRVGKKYLSGGLGFGGACFPRDSRAFIKMAWRVGVQNIAIQQAVDEFNLHHNMSIARNVIKFVPSGARTVALLGVTFKTNTAVVEESPAIIIAMYLKMYGLKVKAYDPIGKINVADMCDSIQDCLEDADVAVIITPWDEIKNITPSDLQVMKNKYLYDCWGVVDVNKFRDAGVKVKVFGINE